MNFNIPQVTGVISTGVANTYVFTPTDPVITSYINGGIYILVFALQNTGASTANISGLGPISILKSDGNQMETFDLETGSPLAFIYDSAASAFFAVSKVASEIVSGTTILDQMGSTGLIEGCALTINGGDPGKVDISVGSGRVYDNYTSPTSPTSVPHTFSGVVALTLTNLATNIVTFLGIKDSTGTITQKTTPFTTKERREYWWIGAVGHPDMTSVLTVTETVNAFNDVNNSLFDLYQAIGTITIGCAFNPNGANLNLDRASGNKTNNDVNFYVDRQDSNNKAFNSDTTISFLPAYRDGSGGTTTDPAATTVDVGNYDDGTGTLATVANNNWTIQRIYFFSSGTTVITYGQVVYNNFSTAIAGVLTEVPILTPLLSDASLRTFLIVKSNTTNLSLTDENQFQNTGKFGNIGSGGSSSVGSSTDLQGAYNLTADGKTLTDSTRGALKHQRGSAADTDTVLEVQNGAGTTTFNVTGNGVATALTLEATGDTTAGDNAAMGYTATEGLILTGQGSTNDVTIKNDTDADVIKIPTGTTNVEIVGNLEIGGQAYEPVQATEIPSGTTETIDWDTGNFGVLDLGSASGNVTLTLSNPNAGAFYFMKIIQGATARTLVWPANVLWPGGTAITLSTGDNDEDSVSMAYDGTNYLATFANDYS